MPYSCGPKDALNFTKRCADLCKKRTGECGARRGAARRVGRAPGELIGRATRTTAARGSRAACTRLCARRHPGPRALVQ